MSGDRPVDPAALLADIVRVPSPSGRVEQVLDLLADRLGRPGVAIRRPADDAVVAERGEGDRILLLQGDVDTAPTGGGWTVDPYGAREEEGRIHGRGASVSKGSVAALVAAFLELPAEVGGRVVLWLADGESVDGLPDGVPRPGAAIWGQPTDLGVARGQRGRALLRLTAGGRTGTAGLADDAESAIHRLVRALDALEGLEPDGGAHGLLGPPSVDPVRVEASGDDRTVPDLATAVLLARTTPDAPAATLAELVGEAVQPHATAEILEEGAGPRVVDAGEGIVRRAAEALRGADPGGWPGFSPGMVELEVPGVVLGPGDPRRAGTPDEHVTRAAVERAVRAYRRIARGWLEDDGWSGRGGTGT